ncbi:MAG: hypothetical protein GAK29_00229 [Acinetobacter bereziniae]|uniref:Uncharacterized protein n=1 Tax=Acinetobacter bereziniae TaxID=106648 RepID=A0A833PJ96_ACIBZ|nr:MAG: hypothetical protein GAK29_00229 [Acinetobacter bereziniae]
MSDGKLMTLIFILAAVVAVIMARGLTRADNEQELKLVNELRTEKCELIETIAPNNVLFGTKQYRYKCRNGQYRTENIKAIF